MKCDVCLNPATHYYKKPNLWMILALCKDCMNLILPFHPGAFISYEEYLILKVMT